MKFLLDTSFLVSCVGYKIDFLNELKWFGKTELCVLDKVIRELEGFGKGQGKASRDAKVALLLLDKGGAEVLRSRRGGTDEEMVKLARKVGMTVCTVDKALKNRLLKVGVGVITIRQCSYLVKS